MHYVDLIFIPSKWSGIGISASIVFDLFIWLFLQEGFYIF